MKATNFEAALGLKRTKTGAGDKVSAYIDVGATRHEIQIRAISGR